MNKYLLITALSSILMYGCQKESLNTKSENRTLKSTQEVMGEVLDGPGIYYLDQENTESTNPVKSRFDMYVPVSEEKVPLIIAFHGGAFMGGQRGDMYPVIFNQTRNFPWITLTNLNNRNIAYAAVDYELCQGNGTNNLLSSLNDCKSYIDYFRSNATTYNIDPDKIILMGFSAGASAALWIGLQNIYPCIKGMVCFDPQASLNLDEWESTIFHGTQELRDYCVSMRATSTILNIESTLYQNMNPNNYPDLSLIDLIDPTDPEVYLVSYNESSWVELSGDFVHHDRHIHRLMTKSIANGHHKMKFMYDNSNAYFGYKYPHPETIINFCDRLFQ